MDQERAQQPRTRSISVEADSRYLGRLKALAALRGQSMGSIVREALDLAVGPELALLDASDVALGQSNVREGNGE